ncbi:hypothetical protein [Sphingobacterium sp.]|uniref:hypothetical protein n=1 Tax=Sphingobacterium sp. TaxID=341027 RepID=UPI0031DEA0DD
MKKLMQIIISMLLPILGFGQQTNNGLSDQISDQGELKMNVKTDTIPIEIWNDQILLKLKVNGKEGFFIWDNGFSFSAVDKPFTNLLSLKELEDLKKIEVNDAIKAKVKLDIKLADVIEIGKAKVENSPILITELEKIFGPNYKISGVLGATTIKKLNWNFNFDQHFVVISPAPFSTKGINIDFGLDPYNTMFTGFGINGKLTNAEIDFGYNGDEVMITSEANPLFSNTKKNKIIGQTSSSLSGLNNVDTSFVVKDFQYVISDTLTTVPHKFIIHVTKSERGIRIGNRFFRHYNCIINFSTNKFILTERKNKIDAMPTTNYGFVILKIDNKLKIILKYDNPNVLIYPHLKLGDEIVEINGKKADYFENNVALRDFQINAIKNKQNLTLKRADGKEFILSPRTNIYR